MSGAEPAGTELATTGDGAAPADDDLRALLPTAEPERTLDGPGALPWVVDLEAAELVALLPSLDAAVLRALHAHETAHRGRRAVLRAIERLQAWESNS